MGGVTLMMACVAADRNPSNSMRGSTQVLSPGWCSLSCTSRDRRPAVPGQCRRPTGTSGCSTLGGVAFSAAVSFTAVRLARGDPVTTSATLAEVLDCRWSSRVEIVGEE